MTEPIEVTFTVNGDERTIRVEPRRTLADALREDCGLTGTHLGCEHGVCGACTVLLDGKPVRSCLMFAVQAEGVHLRTVEGLAEGGKLHPLQQAFWDHHGLQCGCTPGFLMLARRRPRAESRHRRIRIARGTVLQLVPMHRVPEHNQGGARRRGRDAAMGQIGVQCERPLPANLIFRSRVMKVGSGGHPSFRTGAAGTTRMRRSGRCRRRFRTTGGSIHNAFLIFGSLIEGRPPQGRWEAPPGVLVH